ncbi:hypothetical protein [Alteromonas gilva]|uniref:Oligosaccharide biosynthesis protein Alg14 n=1 Tax=Alteromonas gilva TaxID=2987522 RepID=A0ABT5L101_9ALTE|nr:hypothetical protein [Alteromonas gilva]MDC8829552.1 hypothetical protein [Alteromonas gilva]
MKNRKMLAVASSGGHWIQLRKLSKLFESYNTRFITTDKSQKSQEIYIVKDSNLNQKFSLILTAIQVFYVIVRFRPHYIITTGAAPGFLALVFGRMLGCKTIWIDSIANADELSLAGKKAGRWANLWLTQWPELENKDSKLFFKGSVI